MFHEAFMMRHSRSRTIAWLTLAFAASVLGVVWGMSDFWQDSPARTNYNGRDRIGRDLIMRHVPQGSSITKLKAYLIWYHVDYDISGDECPKDEVCGRFVDGRCPPENEGNSTVTVRLPCDDNANNIVLFYFDKNGHLTASRLGMECGSEIMMPIGGTPSR
jgi:hypothetical protein